ncbi:MAG: hypothetical protein QM754_09425 [Tepidisphaeraceae bacterium]
MIVRNVEVDLTETQEQTFVRAVDLSPADIPSWSLQRRRRLKPMGPEEKALLERTLILGTPMAGHFAYETRVTTLRPTAAKLLKYVWATHGETQSVAAVSHALYGRPATLQSIRQTVFRANRALERVGCPLVIHCQSLQVFVQPKLHRVFAVEADSLNASARC